MNEETINTIIQKLDSLGYFKFILPEEKEKVIKFTKENFKEGVLTDTFDPETGESEDSSLDHRMYDADNENLAEGGIGIAIKYMKKVLEREGVEITTVEDNDDAEGLYDVVINGSTYPIFNKEMSNLGRASFWTLAFKRLIEIVNYLLEKSGSEERLYGVYGGNDGKVVLLTPQMYDYISTCRIFKNSSLPFPSEKLPKWQEMLD